MNRPSPSVRNPSRSWLTFAAWLGVVGTVLQLVALYVGPVAGDYRRAFWLEIVGSLLGSWAWRIYKAAKWS